jgi:hypothetical protein
LASRPSESTGTVCGTDYGEVGVLITRVSLPLRNQHPLAPSWWPQSRRCAISRPRWGFLAILPSIESSIDAANEPAMPTPGKLDADLLLLGAIVLSLSGALILTFPWFGRRMVWPIPEKGRVWVGAAHLLIAFGFGFARVVLYLQGQ